MKSPINEEDALKVWESMFGDCYEAYAGQGHYVINYKDFTKKLHAINNQDTLEGMLTGLPKYIPTKNWDCGLSLTPNSSGRQWFAGYVNEDDTYIHLGIGNTPTAAVEALRDKLKAEGLL